MTVILPPPFELASNLHRTILPRNSITESLHQKIHRTASPILQRSQPIPQSRKIRPTITVTHSKLHTTPPKLIPLVPSKDPATRQRHKETSSTPNSTPRLLSELNHSPTTCPPPKLSTCQTPTCEGNQHRFFATFHVCPNEKLVQSVPEEKNLSLAVNPATTTMSFKTQTAMDEATTDDSRTSTVMGPPDQIHSQNR